MAVAPCVFHLPSVGVSCHRTPSAFALDDVGRDLPRLVGTDDCQVGFVAFADETASVDGKERGRIMAGKLYQLFDGEMMRIDQLKQSDQGKLYHRHA